MRGLQVAAANLPGDTGVPAEDRKALDPVRWSLHSTAGSNEWIGLATIPAVGLLTALTWGAESGGRGETIFPTKKAVSYCTLWEAGEEFKGRIKRGPLSKQRNKHW